MALNPIDIISGVVLVISGALVIAGFANLGVFIGSVGLLLQAFKVLLKLGL